MNKRVIKFAHVAAIGIFLVIGLAIVVGQVQMTGQENSNQTNRNANDNSSGNSNANSNTSSGMNSNTGQNMNAAKGTGSGSSLSSADQKFVTDAATSHMAKVELGRLAAQQGSSDAVKQYGQRMVTDHSQANTELTKLASAKGVTLPTTLDTRTQEQITKMSQLSGAAFDKAYMNGMVKDHQKDVTLFQKQTTSATDPDVKAFAAKTLPTLQDHLQMATDINESRTSTKRNTESNKNANKGTSNRNSGTSNENKGMSNQNMNNVNRR
ncbi:MAG: putative rane protein [Blastocatellia bacterium]|nr:putative rane protein [Blastocatellia bacterium]